VSGLRVLVVHSVRERLSNLSRNLLAGAVFLIPPVLAAFDRDGAGLPGGSFAMWLALIFGAGLIGPDASSGVLELVLTRPVTRPQYVLARWLAAVGLAGGAAACQTAVVAAIMATAGHAPGWGAFGSALVPQLTIAIGLPAVLVAFSSMTAGYGDLRAWVLGLLLGVVVELAGQMRHWPWLGRVGTEIKNTVFPAIDSDALSALVRFPWSPLVTWASTVALGLAVAIAVLNRKELSHGGS
jgi:hypothetical protein